MMGAALAETGQAALPGLHLPPPPPDQVPRLAIWGALQEDARVFVGSDGSIQLQVLIAQQLRHHPQAPHLLAVQAWPPASDAHGRALAENEAHARALRMRMPCSVIVSGEALVPATYRGKPVGQLLQVRHIGVADALITHHHHTTTEGETAHAV